MQHSEQQLKSLLVDACKMRLSMICYIACDEACEHYDTEMGSHGTTNERNRSKHHVQ